MSRILVIYGTTDGQTAKVARSMGETLRKRGHAVDVVNAADSAPEPLAYAAIVVAASVHAGGYQRAVRRWVGRHAQALNARPTAFVSVCLGVLQADPAVQQDLAAIIYRFRVRTGWRPTMTRMVAGALSYTRYNPIKRWAMKRIAAKAGGGTDTSRDYEYTDWDDLRAFACEFSDIVQPRLKVAV